MRQISTRDELLGFQDGITQVNQLTSKQTAEFGWIGQFVARDKLIIQLLRRSHKALSKGTINFTQWGRIGESRQSSIYFHERRFNELPRRLNVENRSRGTVKIREKLSNIKKRTGGTSKIWEELQMVKTKMKQNIVQGRVTERKQQGLNIEMNQPSENVRWVCKVSNCRQVLQCSMHFFKGSKVQRF